MVVRFRLLGNVEAVVEGRPLRLGGPRQLCVLAALLIDEGTTLPAYALVSRVWGERPPAQACSTLYTYLSRLRSSLAELPDVRLEHLSGGYRLAVDRDQVDLWKFRD